MKLNRLFALLLAVVMMASTVLTATSCNKATGNLFGLPKDETNELCKDGHDYQPDVICEATGMTDGIIRYTCSVCGDSYLEIIPAEHSVEEAETLFNLLAMYIPDVNYSFHLKEGTVFDFGPYVGLIHKADFHVVTKEGKPYVVADVDIDLNDKEGGEAKPFIAKIYLNVTDAYLYIKNGEDTLCDRQIAVDELLTDLLKSAHIELGDTPEAILAQLKEANETYRKARSIFNLVMDEEGNLTLLALGALSLVKLPEFQTTGMITVEENEGVTTYTLNANAFADVLRANGDRTIGSLINDAYNAGVTDPEARKDYAADLLSFVAKLPNQTVASLVDKVVAFAEMTGVNGEDLFTIIDAVVSILTGEDFSLAELLTTPDLKVCTLLGYVPSEEQTYEDWKAEKWDAQYTAAVNLALSTKASTVYDLAAGFLKLPEYNFLVENAAAIDEAIKTLTFSVKDDKIVAVNVDTQGLFLNYKEEIGTLTFKWMESVEVGEGTELYPKYISYISVEFLKQVKDILANIHWDVNVPAEKNLVGILSGISELEYDGEKSLKENLKRICRDFPELLNNVKGDFDFYVNSPEINKDSESEMLVPQPKYTLSIRNSSGFGYLAYAKYTNFETVDGDTVSNLALPTTMIDIDGKNGVTKYKVLGEDGMSEVIDASFKKDDSKVTINLPMIPFIIFEELLGIYPFRPEDVVTIGYTDNIFTFKDSREVELNGKTSKRDIVALTVAMNPAEGDQPASIKSINFKLEGEPYDSEILKNVPSISQSAQYIAKVDNVINFSYDGDNEYLEFEYWEVPENYNIEYVTVEGEKDPDIKRLYKDAHKMIYIRGSLAEKGKIFADFNTFAPLEKIAAFRMEDIEKDDDTYGENKAQFESVIPVQNRDIVANKEYDNKGVLVRETYDDTTILSATISRDEITIQHYALFPENERRVFCKGEAVGAGEHVCKDGSGKEKKIAGSSTSYDFPTVDFRVDITPKSLKVTSYVPVVYSSYQQTRSYSDDVYFLQFSQRRNIVAEISLTDRISTIFDNAVSAENANFFTVAYDLIKAVKLEFTQYGYYVDQTEKTVFFSTDKNNIGNAIGSEFDYDLMEGEETPSYENFKLILSLDEIYFKSAFTEASERKRYALLKYDPSEGDPQYRTEEEIKTEVDDYIEISLKKDSEWFYKKSHGVRMRSYYEDGVSADVYGYSCYPDREITFDSATHVLTWQEYRTYAVSTYKVSGDYYSMIAYEDAGKLVFDPETGIHGAIYLDEVDDSGSRKDRLDWLSIDFNYSKNEEGKLHIDESKIQVFYSGMPIELVYVPGDGSAKLSYFSYRDQGLRGTVDPAVFDDDTLELAIGVSFEFSAKDRQFIYYSGRDKNNLIPAVTFTLVSNEKGNFTLMVEDKFLTAAVLRFLENPETTWAIDPFALTPIDCESVANYTFSLISNSETGDFTAVAALDFTKIVRTDEDGCPNLGVEHQTGYVVLKFKTDEECSDLKVEVQKMDGKKLSPVVFSYNKLENNFNFYQLGLDTRSIKLPLPTLVGDFNIVTEQIEDGMDIIVDAGDAQFVIRYVNDDDGVSVSFLTSSEEYEDSSEFKLFFTFDENGSPSLGFKSFTFYEEEEEEVKTFVCDENLSLFFKFVGEHTDVCFSLPFGSFNGGYALDLDSEEPIPTVEDIFGEHEFKVPV